MRPLFTLIAIILYSISVAQSQSIIVGAEQTELYFHHLQNKKVGVLANQTSVIGEKHIVDVLKENDINVVKVFAPEHGFRGNKSDGMDIKNSIDQLTGIAIESIYGENKYIPKKLLDGLDVVVFDIQDVGVRFYTYISAMQYMMDACAATNTKMIVLDRPNPNGMYVDGPVLDLKLKSYIGVQPIPVVHGLTVGELAQMINGEGWLENGKCDLMVIPVKNYNHKTVYPLPIYPSPNLPNDQAIKLYPSLALFEGTAISVGRGTYEPFTQIGHPEFTDLPHSFTPESISNMSVNPPLEGKKCYGYNLKDIAFKPQFTLKYLIEFYERFENKSVFFTSYFNKLIGNTVTMQQIKDGLSEKEIKATWTKLTAYKKMRKKYLLYADFE